MFAFYFPHNSHLSCCRLFYEKAAPLPTPTAFCQKLCLFAYSAQPTNSNNFYSERQQLQLRRTRPSEACFHVGHKRRGAFFPSGARIWKRISIIGTLFCLSLLQNSASYTNLKSMQTKRNK